MTTTGITTKGISVRKICVFTIYQYFSNRCYEDCPPNSRCEYSFCECRYGFIKKWGRCESDWGTNLMEQQQQYRPDNFDPFKSCSTAMDCQNMDMNLICNKDLTTQGDLGKCECRRDMKWNTEAMECQVKMFINMLRFLKCSYSLGLPRC